MHRQRDTGPFRLHVEDRSIREDVDEQLRSQLAQVFCALVEKNTLSEIEEFAGVHRSRVSRLRSGKLSEFSIAWLLRTIASLGYDFTLGIVPRPPAERIPRHPTASVVRYDRFGRAVP
ncbi:MAG: XRE family transcriptional regulator [Gemmatimonadaceae bacterium]